MDLRDLKVFGEFQGRFFLPYPFMTTQPSRFASRDEALAYANTVPDRFSYGDLNVFMACVTAYDTADIRVEYHVQYIPNDTPSLRILAYRKGEHGFFTVQRPNADLIDVYTVSPYDLGAAICDATDLTCAGRYPEIVIPEYLPQDQPKFDAGDFVLHDRSMPAEVVISANEVTAYATVQSHWRPIRKWGFDRGKPAVVWVCINGDGEYIYTPDQSCAKPMTRSVLREQIDLLIYEDIASLREFREG